LSTGKINRTFHLSIETLHELKRVAQHSNIAQSTIVEQAVKAWCDHYNLLNEDTHYQKFARSLEKKGWEL
jgi:hypothetical protein